MFRRARERVRTILSNTLERALAMLARRSIGPNPTTSPCEYFHLRKVLKLHYKCDIELISEQVIHGSSLHTPPHIYDLRLGLKIYENPQEITYVTTICVQAKILGRLPTEERAKNNALFRFEREIMMYQQVIPTMKEIQITWDPFLQFQYYDLFPKFYGASMSLKNERATKPDRTATILLQNLADTGYASFLAFCDYNSSEVIVKRLAQLHAIPLSMRIQAQRPYVAKIANVLAKVNIYKDSLDPNREFERICDVLSTEYDIYRYKPDILRHLKLYASNTHKNHVTNNSSWHTICHTKCSILHMGVLADRILAPTCIKFNHLEDVEMDSCCSDLIYFMLTSISSEVLDTRLFDLVKVYFKEFQRIMERHLVLLYDHTYQDFLDEFESRIYVNIGRILFEIGQIYLGTYSAENPAPDYVITNYTLKILTIVKCLISKNWLKMT